VAAVVGVVGEVLSAARAADGILQVLTPLPQAAKSEAQNPQQPRKYTQKCKHHAYLIPLMSSPLIIKADAGRCFVTQKYTF